MAIVNKWAGLLKLENVPVSCCGCGAEAELRSPSEGVRHALHEASYIQRADEEMILLKRTQALFERFPSSRHRIKVSHEHVDRAERSRVQEDAEFDRALAEDTELRQFLTRSSFVLSARLRGVSEALAGWRECLDDSQIRCAVCHDGHYVIEAALFDQLT